MFSSIFTRTNIIHVLFFRIENTCHGSTNGCCNEIQLPSVPSMTWLSFEDLNGQQMLRGIKPSGEPTAFFPITKIKILNIATSMAKMIGM